MDNKGLGNMFLCMQVSNSAASEPLINNSVVRLRTIGFPLENEEPDTFCYSSAQVPTGVMGFTPSSTDNKSHGINKTGLHENKSSQERESTESADEDYIVFCFREDGAIRVIKDGKTEASDRVDRVNRSSSRHVQHKLIYGEHFEKVCNSSHDSLSHEDEATTSEGDSMIICNRKGKEKWSINLDTEPPTAMFRGKNHIEEISECDTSTAKSRDSHRSDSSSSSFAFPVLSWEGVESPAQMPKPDALQVQKRHHKAARAALVQCCRF